MLLSYFFLITFTETFTLKFLIGPWKLFLGEGTSTLPREISPFIIPNYFTFSFWTKHLKLYRQSRQFDQMNGQLYRYSKMFAKIIFIMLFRMLTTQSERTCRLMLMITALTATKELTCLWLVVVMSKDMLLTLILYRIAKVRCIWYSLNVIYVQLTNTFRDRCTFIQYDP